MIKIETWHKPDMGEQENVSNLLMHSVQCSLATRLKNASFLTGDCIGDLGSNPIRRVTVVISSLALNWCVTSVPSSFNIITKCSC